MYSYVVKSEREIKQDAELICNNLAPLVGCREGNLKWSPKTAHIVCSNLEVSGLNCTNISDDHLNNEFIVYKFDSNITQLAGKIKNLVMNFDNRVLDDYYVSIIPNIFVPRDLSLNKKLQLTARISTHTNSTILDASCENASIQNLSICRNICQVLLSSFAVKYLLTIYCTNVNSKLDTTEINVKNIDRIIANIDYIKFVVSQSSVLELQYFKSSNFLCQQLTTLRKNMQMIKYYILNYKE